MERFMAILSISIYTLILIVAVWFAFHVIKSGKMESEKDIEITENKRPENANNRID